MQRTVETCDPVQHRIAHVVPARMDAIKDFILCHDFPTFACITMQDSNQFHAVALDTDPPIFYLNDVSRAIIAIIT
jgi:diphosphomevalonate decarboxylase